MPNDNTSAETDDGIRTLTLDSPPRHLLNPGFMAEIADHLMEADRDQDVRGLVITATGDVFCGGLDVGAIESGEDPRRFARALVDLLGLIPRLGIPVVAALNGDAVASGASLACATDYVVAVESARIGTYEASIGIWPMLAQVPLIHRLGPRAAMENVGSGEPFDSARAVEVGAVNEIAPRAALLERARRWIDLASRAGTAGRIGRPAFYELAEMSYQDALDSALARFSKVFE